MLSKFKSTGSLRKTNEFANTGATELGHTAYNTGLTHSFYKLQDTVSSSMYAKSPSTSVRKHRNSLNLVVQRYMDRKESQHKRKQVKNESIALLRRSLHQSIIVQQSYDKNMMRSGSLPKDELLSRTTSLVSSFAPMGRREHSQKRQLRSKFENSGQKFKFECENKSPRAVNKFSAFSDKLALEKSVDKLRKAMYNKTTIIEPVDCEQEFNSTIDPNLFAKSKKVNVEKSNILKRVETLKTRLRLNTEADDAYDYLGKENACGEKKATARLVHNKRSKVDNTEACGSKIKRSAAAIKTLKESVNALTVEQLGELPDRYDKQLFR